MHVSGIIKRSLAQVMSGAAGAQDVVVKPAGKKPTAKEIRKEEKRLGEQAREGTWLEKSHCYSYMGTFASAKMIGILRGSH